MDTPSLMHARLGLRDEQTTLTLHQSIAKIFVYNACVGGCETSPSPLLVVVLAADSTAVASADLFAATSRGNANEILIHLRPSRRVVYAKKAHNLPNNLARLGSCHVNPLQPA